MEEKRDGKLGTGLLTQSEVLPIVTDTIVRSSDWLYKV